MKFNKKDEGRSVSNMTADKYFYLILIVMRNAMTFRNIPIPHLTRTMKFVLSENEVRLLITWL